MREVEVAGVVERHEVDVGVRHIDAHNCLANLDAGTHFFQSASHAATEQMQLGEELFIEVEDVVDLLFGDAKDMPTDNGVDVEEGETMLGLGHTVAGNLACHNLAENACHNGFVLPIYFNVNYRQLIVN